MKKINLPNRLGERILLLILALFTFLFFSNDFGLIDIQKTAIVLAAGIDAGENGGYTVSAEIAVAEASTGGRQVNEVTVSGEGETVAQAFRDINLKTGCFPKISFCDLIVLGEEVVQEDVFNVLGFFLRNEYMSDNCLLAACEGKAADILSSPIPVDGMTAIGLQKILSTEAKEAGNISTVNLKDFAVGYYSDHKSSYMPYIRKVPQPEGGGQQGQNGQSGQGGQTAGEFALPVAQTTDPSAENMFNAAMTAVFYEGKEVGILTEEESFAFNLVSNHIRLATIDVPYQDKIYALGLKNIKGKVCFSLQNNVPTLEIELRANAQTTDTSRAESIEEVTQYLSVKEGVLRETEKILKEALLSAFENCRAVRCDLFEVVNKLKKCESRYYGSYKDIVLDRTVPLISVTVTDLA
jgi:Ger(x)C family germination protein